MKKGTTDGFIKKSTEIHNGKYDYSLCMYENNTKKVTIICREHGEFLQSPAEHLNGCGCGKCKSQKLSKLFIDSRESFVEKSNKAHGDKYDYSLVKYEGRKEKVEIICPEHGVFSQCAGSHIAGIGCPKCGAKKNSEALKSNTEDFTKKAKEKHGDKYDYSLVEYVGGKSLIKIICPEHGEFNQMASAHLRGCGCRKCFVKKLSEKTSGSNDSFIKSASSIHGDKYDYSLVEYKGWHKNVRIICKKHGEFLQRPASHLSGSDCPCCSSVGSRKEDDIFDFVKSLGVSPEKGLRNLIGNGKEVDIFVPSKNIAIEFNGLYWHSEAYGKDENYHLSKTELLAEKGIRLIHIFEDEYVHKFNIIKSRLQSILVDLPKIHARKCEIREIDPKVKNEFLEKTHIQGGDRATTSLGAFHGNDLVAVMTFYKGRGTTELSRFSTIPDFRVVGIAGKLLKFYELKYKPREIISHADKRWSEGGVYKALGFEKAQDNKPDYWYFCRNLKSSDPNRMKRLHRSKFALPRLEKFFGETFPKEKTEREIMQEKGFDRIWDCGSITFSKKYDTK